MTLNDLEWSFGVKIWSELGIQWAGVLAFGENCSEICRATHILSAAKNVVQLGTAVKPVNCIYSFTLTVLTHAVH